MSSCWDETIPTSEIIATIEKLLTNTQNNFRKGSQASEFLERRSFGTYWRVLPSWLLDRLGTAGWHIPSYLNLEIIPN